MKSQEIFNLPLTEVYDFFVSCFLSHLCLSEEGEEENFG